MSEQDQLKMWKERGGQIEWRLADAKKLVKKMERDLAECDKHIKFLSKSILNNNEGQNDPHTR